MNAERRKMIREALDKIGEAKTLLEIVRDDEEGAKENLPESIADGEKGDAMQEKIDALEEVLSDLDEIEGKLEEVTQ